MKYLIFFILISAGVTAQVNPFISGSVGYLNNVAIGFRGGVMAGKFKIEAGASFSSVTPFQHHLSLGYVLGDNWQLTPLAGVVQYHYGSDKGSNEIKPAWGLEVAKQLNLQGTNGEYLLDGAAVYAEYFGKFAGIGMRIIF